MSAQVIALTAPCHACCTAGRVLDFNAAGDILGIVDCPVCHGTGDAIRDCVLELSARIRLNKRKGGAIQRAAPGQHIGVGKRAGKSETLVLGWEKIDSGGRKQGKAKPFRGGPF